MPNLNLYTKYKRVWDAKENSLDTLYQYIKNLCIDIDDYGNITVYNTPKTSVAAFCCHLDTVHSDKPNIHVIKNDILISTNDVGVGGDDKCGIVACLEMLESDVPCKAIFFREEETGCKGSRAYNAKSLKNDLFLIEIDRRGDSDLIFNSGEVQLCDKQFEKEVKKAFPHGKKTQGLLTDVNMLDNAQINMMNLSAGYYLPHTKNEYVVLSDLQRTINCLYNFAKNYTEKRKYIRKQTGVFYDAYTRRSLWNICEEDKGAGAEDYALLQGLENE